MILMGVGKRIHFNQELQMCKEHTKYKQYCIYKKQAYLGPICGTRANDSSSIRIFYCLFYQLVSSVKELLNQGGIPIKRAFSSLLTGKS